MGGASPPHYFWNSCEILWGLPMSEIKLIKTKEGHFYATEYGKLPSVTTILQIVANPALERWKKNTPNAEEIGREAARIGTKSHELIERYLKHKPIAALIDSDTEPPFMAFVTWQSKHSFTLTDSERSVWSESGYAGTVDLTATMDGVFYLIDLKTSKHIYKNHLLQVAAYRHAYEQRTGEEIERIAILRLDKTTGAYEWREYTESEYQRAKDAFLHLCEYWHLARAME
jgi:hypothetical protein